MRTALFFSALIFYTTTLDAQNFQKGYIVLNSGDTLQGEVDYGSKQVNPRKLVFRNSTGVNNYEVKDIRSFAILGGEQFSRYSISYRESAADLTTATDVFEGPLVNSEEWLNVIYKGKYSLYSLITSKRNYFFTEKNSEGLQELIYRVRLSNGEMQKDIRFRQLLTALALEAGNNTDLLKKIEQAEYNVEDLLKVYELLNGGSGIILSKKKIRARFDLGVAGIFYSFDPSGGLYNDGSGAYAFNTTDFKSTLGFKIGVGYTSFSQHNNGRLQAHFGLDIGSISINGSNNGGGSFQKEQYSGNFLILDPNFSIYYIFNTKSLVKVGFGPTVGYNFILSNNTRGRFENPGIVISKEGYPAASGEFVNYGCRLIAQGGFGGLSIGILKSTNIYNNALTGLSAFGISLGYNYYLK